MRGDPTPVRLELLGPLRVWRGRTEVRPGWPKQQAVLVALALNPGRVVARDALVDAVWGDRAPRSAISDLHTYVSRLRRLIDPPTGPGQPARNPPPMLVTEYGGYRLRIEPDAIDATVFERDLVAAADQRARGEFGTAVSTLGSALAAWRGTALMSVPGPLADLERRRLEELRVSAAEDHADLRLSLGPPSPVTPELFKMVHDHPLRERPWTLLMLALYRCGRIAEALATFQEMRRLFIADLGIEPGDAVHRLNNQIIAADPALDPPQPPTPDHHRRPAEPAATDPAALFRPHRPPAELPHAVCDFVGRRAALQQIEAAYLKGSPGSATVVALQGMAGVGKTALAIDWARRHTHRFPDGQLYVNLRGHDSTADPLPATLVLTRFLRALGVRPALIPVDSDEQAALYRSVVAGRRMLVVLDNAADDAQVEPLLPGCGESMVIVTSRLRLSGLVRRCGARSIPVAVLRPEESLSLLRSVIGAHRVDAEPDDAREISRLADHLPLALRIVAARLADNSFLNLGDAVRMLYDDRLAMVGSGQEERSAVRAAFDISYQALPPAAQRMFRLIGLIPGPDFDVHSAAALCATQSLETAAGLLDLLATASLLERQARDRYQIHDLLRLYAAENAVKEESTLARSTAYALLLDWYIRTTDSVTHSHGMQFLRLPWESRRRVHAPPAFADQRSAVRWLEIERPNLLAAIHHAANGGHPEAAWSLADALRGFFRLRPYGSEWLQAATAGLEAARRAGNVRAQAAMYLNLADSYQALGQCSAALLHDSRALATSTEIGWTEGQAAALSGLGRSRWTMGDLDEAAGYLTEALARYREIGSLSGQAACLGSLGRAEHDRGNLGAALALYLESDALNEETASHYGSALTLFYLGAVYRDLGRFTEAGNHLHRALASARTNGLVQVEAMAAAYLGVLSRETSSPSDLGNQLAESRRLAGRTGDRRVEAECRNAVAETLCRLGEHHRAAPEYEAALEAAESAQYLRGEIRALIGLAVTGERSSARARALRALELADSRSYRLMQAEALCALAELDCSTGHGTPDALRFAARAQSLSRAAGYQPGEELARRAMERLRTTAG